MIVPPFFKAFSFLQSTCLTTFLLLGGIGGLGILADSASLEASESRINWVVRAYEKNREAVVCIQGDKVDEFSLSSKETGKSYNGMGTGIIVDPRGYIVTNYHVVEGIRKIQVMTYDRTNRIATLVARDKETDLAIIKIDTPQPLRTICLGRSDDLMPGECCMAIGNPYGYDFSLTDGRISGINREVEVNDSLVYSRAIQTSTPINPGNSGGPLINIDGEMIGINAAIRQGAECIAFAIPVDQVVEVAARLIAEIGERTAFHGLDVWEEETDDSDDSRSAVVVVRSVIGNSPAAQAGLQEGDVVRSVGGETIRSKLDFQRALLELKPREDVVLSVLRNSEIYEIAMTVSTPRDDSMVRSRSHRVATPKTATVSTKTTKKKNLDDLVWDVIGIRYSPMSKEEYHRALGAAVADRPHGGVLVKSVREGSVLSELGVLPGDVIVGIHEWVTTSQNDVRYVATVWPTIKTKNNKVQVLLYREGVSYFTEVPLLP